MGFFNSKRIRTLLIVLCGTAVAVLSSFSFRHETIPLATKVSGPSVERSKDSEVGFFVPPADDKKDTPSESVFVRFGLGDRKLDPQRISISTGPIDSTSALYSSFDHSFYASSSRAGLLISIDEMGQVRKIPTDPTLLLTLQKFVSQAGVLILESSRIDPKGLRLFIFEPSVGKVTPFLLLEKVSVTNGDYVTADRNNVFVTGIEEDRYVLFCLNLEKKTFKKVATSEPNTGYQILGIANNQLLVSQFKLSPENANDLDRDSHVLRFSPENLALLGTIAFKEHPQAIATRHFRFQSEDYLLLTEGQAGSQRNYLAKLEDELRLGKMVGPYFDFWFSGKPWIVADEMILFNTFDNSLISGVSVDLRTFKIKERYTI